MSEESKFVAQETESIIGGVAWLMLQSQPHQHAFIGDLHWSLIPALSLRQFKVFKKDDKHTVGFASWAYLDDTVIQRIINTGRVKLAPDDWRSGETLYIIDIISPFAADKVIATTLYDSVFNKSSDVYAFRPDESGKQLITVPLSQLVT